MIEVKIFLISKVYIAYFNIFFILAYKENIKKRRLSLPL